MNVSLVLLGITTTTGSILVYQSVRKSKVGFCLMAIAGIGAIIVGLFPEDTVFWAHILGQDLAFVGGNIALIVFGFTFHVRQWFRWYSILSGAVALIALTLFLTHNNFSLGLGGMERTIAYPLLFWLTHISHFKHSYAQLKPELLLV